MSATRCGSLALELPQMNGNVSVKLDDGTFIATPTGVSKSFITPDILVRINDKGEVLRSC